MSRSDALIRLRELAERRHRDPGVSLEAAQEFLAADDPRVAATASGVVGLLQHELGQLAAAAQSHARAVALSAAHGWRDDEAIARANLASTLLALGDAAGADREIAVALALTSPASRGLVAARQGVVLQRTGRLKEALVAYQRARRWLEEVDDQPYLAVVHLNLGVLHAYQGHMDAALDCLARSEEISRRRDLPVLVAMATHNMGFHLGRLGKIPDALAVFARTRETYAALGNPARLVAVLDADRCEVLLLAGLVVEARAAARWAVDALTAVGDVAHLMECRLLLARVLLAAGEYPAASEEAALAARGLASAGRRPWAALARYVGVQAEILENEDKAEIPRDLLPRCRRIAAELETTGWPVESVHVHTFAGRIALSLGRPAIARAELVGSAMARARGTADLRAQAWHAYALLRVAEGNRSGARRALTRGMAVVDDYRASLGATELRVSAAGHGADLARFGIRLALQDGRPAELLRWAERWRAGALRRPAVRPPEDEQLAENLTALRQANADLRAVRLNPPSPGNGGPAATDAAVAPLVSRIAALEQAVRARTLEAHDDAVATGRVDIAAVRAALGARWLVEYVFLDGELHAVTVTEARVRLHHLGSALIEEEKDYLLFAIRRLMAAPSARAAATVRATADRLDRLLLRPLRLPPDAPLVIVPTGLLHGLPWTALPSVAGRSATVAPSAAVWLGEDAWRPSRPAPATGPAVTVVAGPQLPGADEEVRRVAAQYPTAQWLAGPAATTSAVVAALEGADVAHLAAHGSFRADSPLFSSVLLADGPITVYELERLRRAPQTVVLASCDAAVNAVHVGDELVGTASALIGLGVRWVIAPVMPVPDGSTVTFMVALHQLMSAGRSPAAALAGARLDQDEAVAAAFICIGCDDAGVSG